jgi:hypothetical protein
MQPTQESMAELFVSLFPLLFRFHKMNASLVFPLFGLLASAALWAKIKPEILFFLRQISAKGMITIESPTAKEPLGNDLNTPTSTKIARKQTRHVSVG